MLSELDILNELNTLSEDQMIEMVIMPLYKKKFKGIFHDLEFSGKDKREDEGIDIQYYEKSHDTKAKEYSGIQVKQGDINTSKGANGIAAISIQAQQAFQKRICNTKEKSDYRIRTYVILTSGEITAKARGKIVDQFKDKSIRFIDGKTIAEWVRESYLEEFIHIFNLSTEEEEEDDEDITPLEAVIGYLEENYEDEIDEIKDSLNTLGRYKNRIIKALMIESPQKTFSIAKAIGLSLSSVDEEIRSLIDEDLIDGDEDGVSINEKLVGGWSVLKNEAEERIDTLGYSDEVSIEDVVDFLFKKYI